MAAGHGPASSTSAAPAVAAPLKSVLAASGACAPWAWRLRAPVVWQGVDMATDSAHRDVTVVRTANGMFTVTNARGGRIAVGTGGDADFTPTELLLAAIGSCTAIDVDILTSRRAEPDAFEVRVSATKVRDAAGNRLTDIEVTFQIVFPRTEQGDAARALLPDAAKKSHDRLCTVGRTVEIGTPIKTRIE
jgi:putative redox protein